MEEKETALIVMLTYNDLTVPNAPEIFDRCKDSKAEYWGFKEDGLPLDKMKELYANIKACGKMAVLEVVAYTEDLCIKGAQMAVECGCDILMGTVYSDAVNNLCREHGIRYMPFVGKIYDRPSVLEGDIDDMIAEARSYIEKGAYGIDLLAYRYTGDYSELIRRFVSEVNAPVCIAGSVNSYERLDEIKDASPWAFTIGSAFFDKAFGDDFGEQIDKVCEYV
ncbi:MAG: hypothetical protein J5802_06535 [Butyrivibrio sp.]|nr:hypothetical protein [Butyrivibrio sp.]